VADKITVQVDSDLVAKMRAKASADGLPGADTIPDEELLAALIRAELGDEVVWVNSKFGLNLRTVPVTGGVLKTLADKVRLTVLGRQAGWLKVHTADGVVGWVSADFVTAQEPQPVDVTPVEVTPASGTVWVRSEFGLNLRAEPVTGNVLRILADREKLTVVGSHEGWLKVRTTGGLVGWVAVKFVSDVDPQPPTPSKINVRGIHGSAGVVAPPRHLWDSWINELKAMGMAWYKQMDAGDPNDVGADSTLAWARRLKGNGIEPIIRYYQAQMFPGRLHDGAFEKMRRYAAEGMVWCEIGNEPNLDRVEWHSDYHGKVTWQNPLYPRIIVENWIRDAEKAVAVGARPGFYALAPTDWGTGRPHPQLSSVMFYRRMFEHVAGDTNLRWRFRRLFEPDKAWLAVHVSTYEWPLTFNPFPSNAPPYDMCLRGYEVPLRYLRELLLGDTQVIVMSTEGGVFTKDSGSMGGHQRLKSNQEHAQRTVAMFDWLQDHSPLQAMCPWLISNVRQVIGHSDPAWAHDGWFDGGPPGFDPKPVVPAMRNTKPAF
jgi:hypothetical protein